MPDNMPDRHTAVNSLNAGEALAAGSDSPHDLGMEEVRRIREARGLTQAQLADRSGLNQATISKIERGTANVTLDVILHIAEALGVQPFELFAQPELERRILEAYRRLGPSRGAAALVVLEAMVGQHPSPDDQ